jgi:hypothetical protein
MRHWAMPFFRGLIFCALLIVAAAFSPLWLPESVPASVFLPDRRLDADLFRLRYLSEGKDAVQNTMVIATAAVAIGYIAFAITHLFRPTGPGDAAAGWRHGVCWFCFVCVLAAASGGAYIALSVWLRDGSEAIAMEWAYISAILSGVLFWIVAIIGTERMLRPAIFLGSRVPS